MIYEEVTTKMKQKNCLLLFTFSFNLILYISVADNTCFVKAVSHIGEVPTIFSDMGIRGVPTIFPDGGSKQEQQNIVERSHKKQNWKGA